MNMEFFLIIIILVLLYLLFKKKDNKTVKDIKKEANVYGKAFKDAASTFKNSLNENKTNYPINDSSDDVDFNTSEIKEMKEIKDEAFSKTSTQDIEHLAF